MASRLPRGIWYVHEPARRLPYGVRWSVGKGAERRKLSRFFSSKTDQQKFARDLAGDLRQNGIDALRLNTDEARDWRAFKARIGDASLEDVAGCWLRFGAIGGSLTVNAAREKFVAAKVAEGIDKATERNYRPILDHFCGIYGSSNVGAVTPDHIAEWLDGLKLAPWSRRSYLSRVRAFFNWLQRSRLIAASPCIGLRGPKIVAETIEILTPEQGAALFEANKDETPELIGRLALEAFAGLRASSAGKLAAADLQIAERGITLPALKLKTRQRQYIDGLPDNLWAWLERSKPETWEWTDRRYRHEKALAFCGAKVPLLHNCLRHSFATYHVAAHKDASRTATLLCHTSPKMLYAHYKGRATEVQGRAWFSILPSISC